MIWIYRCAVCNEPIKPGHKTCGKLYCKSTYHRQKGLEYQAKKAEERKKIQ